MIPDDYSACSFCCQGAKSTRSYAYLKKLGTFVCEKKCVFYPRREIIFRERTKPRGLYIIRRGKVKVYKIGYDGKEQIISILGAGQMIGYKSLLYNENYIHTAETLEDSVIHMVPTQAFEESLQKNPDFHNILLKQLSCDLTDAEEKLTALSSKPIKSRLAGAILRLEPVYYDLEKDIFAIRLRREDLANLIGTTKETVSRVLNHFKKKGYLKVKNRTIEVLDKERLQYLSNG